MMVSHFYQLKNTYSWIYQGDIWRENCVTVIGVSVGATGALTLFTPLAARMHVATLIALRVAMGLAEVRKQAQVMKNLL